MTDRHPSTEVLAAFADGGLTPTERVDVEAHLATCRACRRELVEAKDLLAGAPVARTQTSRRVALLVASAAALVLIMVLVPRNRGSFVVSDERVPNVDEGAVVHTITPSPEIPVVSREVVFTWRRDDASSYRVRVVDSTGTTLWSFATTDTSVALPGSVRLRPSSRYYWYVDARRPDGFSLTSGKQEFRTR